MRQDRRTNERNYLCCCRCCCPLCTTPSMSCVCVCARIIIVRLGVRGLSLGIVAFWLRFWLCENGFFLSFFFSSRGRIGRERERERKSKFFFHKPIPFPREKKEKKKCRKSTKVVILFTIKVFPSKNSSFLDVFICIFFLFPKKKVFSHRVN